MFRSFFHPANPFLGARLAVFLIIVFQVMVNDQILIGGRYLMPAIEMVLLLSVTSVHHARWMAHMQDTGPRKLLRLIDGHVNVLTLLMVAVLLVVNTLSLRVLLSHLLSDSETSGKALLLDALMIWANNLVIFALMYWEVDRGGPWKRITRKEGKPDFQFTQMSDLQVHFEPSFTDYLFMAFTCATAFSPTDTLPLTPRAKWLMMVQATLSFVTVAIVAARAVNILN